MMYQSCCSQPHHSPIRRSSMAGRGAGAAAAAACWTVADSSSVTRRTTQHAEHRQALRGIHLQSKSITAATVGVLLSYAGVFRQKNGSICYSRLSLGHHHQSVCERTSHNQRVNQSWR